MTHAPTSKTLTAALLCAVFLSVPVMAEPYCKSLLDKRALEKKYKRLAPIYSDRTSGWIFTSDQFDSRFEMDQEAEMLLREIVSDFKQRGLPLAILVAPPRPLLAGKEVLQQAVGERSKYPADQAGESFSRLIAQLRSAGAIAPDIHALTKSDRQLREIFYFKRDSHWTPVGAAYSASALAAAIKKTLPELFPNAGPLDLQKLTSSEKLEEPGSLSAIVKATCGRGPQSEFSALVDFASVSPLAQMGLLGNEGGTLPRVALLGTSFSQRSKRDAYQVADALAAALGANVANLSISGGGMIGTIEANALHGRLHAQSFDFAVWEVPYTESFNAIPKLRQLLGALQSEDGRVIQTAVSPTGAVRVELRSEQVGPGLGTLAIDLGGLDLANIDVRLDRVDGGSAKLKLSRKSRIPGALRSPLWYTSLKGFQLFDIEQIKIKIHSRSIDEEVVLELYYQ